VLMCQRHFLVSVSLYKYNMKHIKHHAFTSVLNQILAGLYADLHSYTIPAEKNICWVISDRKYKCNKANEMK
jgi:hypothetical protein